MKPFSYKFLKFNLVISAENDDASKSSSSYKCVFPLYNNRTLSSSSDGMYSCSGSSLLIV